MSSTPSPARAIDPRAVQHALVCMHFDPKYAARVRGRDPLPASEHGLGEAERALLRELDLRALATDDMRRARAVHAIVDEYPVSAAVLGLDAVDRFFSSPAFRACVFGRGSMALCFGKDYLRDRARGAGLIETAMAHARRASAAAVPTQPEPALVCRPGIVPLIAPAGSLEFYRGVRGRLGDVPLETLARRRKPWSKAPPRRGREHLLIEANADGSMQLGTGSAALVDLLLAARTPPPTASLAAVAIELGAEAAEVDELFDELLRDALLARLAPELSS